MIGIYLTLHREAAVVLGNQYINLLDQADIITGYRIGIGSSMGENQCVVKGDVRLSGQN